MSLDEVVETFDFLNEKFQDGTNAYASEDAVVDPEALRHGRR